MIFPCPILELTPALRERWKSHFASGHDRERYIEEGIWRRTQHEENAVQSGWTAEDHSRRRIVHYRYKYGCHGSYLTMDEFYLLHCVTAPSDEIEEFEQGLICLLQSSNWELDGDNWNKDGLVLKCARYSIHPKDVQANRSLPTLYNSHEVVIRSNNCVLSNDERDRPWYVLAGGPRVKDKRGDPTIVPDLSSLRDYLPFQVEVGCGTSFEAGIPPLHRLHEIYRVTKRQSNSVASYEFVLRPDEDPLLAEIISDWRAKKLEFTEMFCACLLAEPTLGLIALRHLADRGHFVGPVITNNFDVLAARAGLQECFVRRYDQRIPHVPFIAAAKSLLVIGNHADRRAVQSRARERGMKIFFLDPEGFWIDGKFEAYPLESARHGDILCQKEATPGLIELENFLT